MDSDARRFRFRCTTGQTSEWQEYRIRYEARRQRGFSLRPAGMWSARPLLPMSEPSP